MGILGDVQLIKRTRVVPIGISQTGEEVNVLVTAPALQLSSRLQQQIKDPEPPVLLNSAGKPRFKTDPRTGEPIKINGQLVPMLDYDNDDYLQQVEGVGKARTIAMIFDCAKFPGSSAVAKNGEGEVAYQFARWRELEEAGCDVGSFSLLARACVELSAPMSKDEVEEARRALGTDKETQDQQREGTGKDAKSGK